VKTEIAPQLFVSMIILAKQPIQIPQIWLQWMIYYEIKLIQILICLERLF